MSKRPVRVCSKADVPQVAEGMHQIYRPQVVVRHLRIAGVEGAKHHWMMRVVAHLGKVHSLDQVQPLVVSMVRLR